MNAYTRQALDLFQLNDPKKQYLNLAELYYRPWDPLTELIQNALASILERQAELRSAGKPVAAGKISVTIDAAAQRFSVEDNGKGFDTLEDIAANRTTRDIRGATPYSGFGLGLSSVVARSEVFSVKTVNTQGKASEAVWSGVYGLLHSAQRVRGLQPDSCSGPTQTKAPPTTVVEAGGADGFKELWEWAANPQRLFEVLLAHSALGHTSHIWDDASRPNCRYQVTIQGGPKSLKQTGTIGFPFVEGGAKGTFRFEDHEREGKIPATTDLIIYKKKGRRSARRQYSLNIYVACESERGRNIPESFGGYLESLTNNRILVSINGFLQSFALERPPERMTRSLWGNILAVVDASDNIVEPGRNRIADLYVHDVHDALIDAIKRLDKLVADARDAETYRNPIDISTAKTDAEIRARTTPLNYSVGTKLHLLKTPTDEQEVVGLFCELLGNGLIRNCDVYQLGGSQFVYDCYLRYTFQWGDVGVQVRPKKDEGKRSLDLARQHEKTLVADFKTSADKLVSELLSGKTRKKLAQLDLLICWEEGTLPEGYSLELIEEDERFFAAATHILKEKVQGGQGSQCEVLVLSEFLDRIEAGLSE